MSDDNQEYECLNEGCIGDKIFEHRPESWWEERGLDTPKNCETCREWFEEQKEIGPITAVCAFCEYRWTVEVGRRISYHRTTGNWDEYWETNEEAQTCWMCVEFPFRKLKLAARKAERKYSNLSELERARNRAAGKARKLQSDNAALDARPEGRSTKRIDVPMDAIFYQGIPTPAKHVKRHGKNQLTHILKEGHEWGQNFGTKDPGAILSLASRIARSSNEPHIKQYKSQKYKGNIVKYDQEQQVVVIVCRDSRSLTDYRIITSYPMEPVSVLKKLSSKEWK